MLDEYGYRGGVLIFGGIVLNTFVGISLFHPVKWHMKSSPSEYKDSLQERTNTQETKEQFNDVPEESLWPSLELINKGTSSTVSSDATDVFPEQDITGRNINRRASEGSHISILSTDILSGSIVTACNISPTDDAKEVDGSRSLSVMKTLYVILVRVVKTTISDLGIVRYRRAVIIVISIFLSSNCRSLFFMVMPFAVQAEGHTLEDTAWIISVLGMSTMTTRLTILPLSDWKKFNHRICLMSGYALSGTSLLGKQFFLLWLLYTSCNMRL